MIYGFTDRLNRMRENSIREENLNLAIINSNGIKFI